MAIIIQFMSKIVRDQLTTEVITIKTIWVILSRVVVEWDKIITISILVIKDSFETQAWEVMAIPLQTIQLASTIIFLVRIIRLYDI
jgi:hypothetical protein